MKKISLHIFYRPVKFVYLTALLFVFTLINACSKPDSSGGTTPPPVIVYDAQVTVLGAENNQVIRGFGCATVFNPPGTKALTSAEFDRLFDDTRRLAYKHDIKAEEIEETELFNKTTGSSGVIYELKGNTATNLNFYISSGTSHFLRGALYFNAKTEIDSIQPVFQFIKQDVIKMIETVQWKAPATKLTP